jgi:hypothetical protein
MHKYNIEMKINEGYGVVDMGRNSDSNIDIDIDLTYVLYGVGHSPRLGEGLEVVLD